VISLDIIIDSREHHKKYFRDKLASKGLQVDIQKLPTGDFLIFGGDEKTSFIIERKTPTDFMSSIFQNRIFDQLKRMKETEASPVILIEGSLAYPRKWIKVDINSITGAISSILYGWKVPIIVLPSRSWTVSFLASLARRAGGIKNPFTLRTSPAKSMSLCDKQKYLLQGLPGIGAKISEVILSEYGSPEAFFEAVNQQNISIKGLGKKALQHIREVLLTNTSKQLKDKISK